MNAQADQTLWLLASTTLLILTVFGVALFYGGMVRRKNAINTMGFPFLALTVVSLAWNLSSNGWAKLGTTGTSLGSYQDGLLSLNRGMMASVALALVTGGVVERIRLSFFLMFGLCWIATVYTPLSQWLWGGGWLTKLGSLDFSGGAVIHISAGVSALVMAILIGPRKGYGRIDMMPNHLPFSFCGAAFMWVGWFGFTGAGAEVSMTNVTSAFVTIQLSAAAATLAWIAAEWLQRDKPTALGAMSGAVAGLVAIAPGAAFVSPLSAIVIGVGAGALCYMVINYVKLILGYDDSLDVFGMHGVGGTWGMVATGLFASAEINSSGNDGLFYGYPYQFFVQVVATLAAWVLAGAVTWLLWKILSTFISPRVDPEAEMMGLDLHQHGEKGYS